MFEKWKEQAEQKRREREQAERMRAFQRKQAEEEARLREQRKKSVRIITGDLKHKYAIIDTVRAIGYQELNGGQIDPHAATTMANEFMQEAAVKLNADAIIHATYQILRYTQAGRNGTIIPVYESHAFGTLVKILGPPEDWEDLRVDENDEPPQEAFYAEEVTPS